MANFYRRQTFGKECRTILTDWCTGNAPHLCSFSSARCSRCDLLSDRDEAILTKTKSSDEAKRRVSRKTDFLPTAASRTSLGYGFFRPCGEIASTVGGSSTAGIHILVSFTIFASVSAPIIHSVLIFFHIQNDKTGRLRLKVFKIISINY